MNNTCIPDKNIIHAEVMKENLSQYNNLKKEKGDSINKFEESKKTNNKQINEKHNETKKLELSNKVTREDLQKLCDQLAAFNSRIQTAREIIHLRYDLPYEMREKLEVEAQELECLYVELQNSANSIETIRNQRAALRAETLCTQTHLRDMKNDVDNELEVIVSVYDNTMMEQWKTVKSGNSIPAVENFLHDVKGKLEAMKNLQLLGSQKLLDLQSEGKKSEFVPKKEKKRRNKEERSGRSQSKSHTSGSNVAVSSQTSLQFLLDTESEDMFDNSAVNSVLYSLVCDQVMNLPAWTQGALDID